MATCKQCGTELNGARFCPGCGASADGARPAQGEYRDERQRCLMDFENMRTYFGAKAQEYADLDAATAEVEARSANSFMGWIIGAVLSAIVAIFVNPIFLLVVAGCIALFVVKRKKNKELLQAAKARQDGLTKMITEYYHAYGYCPIGMEYTKPDTLDVLYGYVSSGRATTPMEAINTYVVDKQQEEIKILQEQVAEAARKTAENTKKAAKQAKKAARYSSAGFWLK